MSQQSPLFVRMSDAQITDEDQVSGMQWLVVITVFVTIGAMIGLFVIHNDHVWHGDRAATPEFMACANAEFDESITTGTPYDVEHCKPQMPWYAAHPVWYALIVGAVVFGVGRIGVFMVRMERSRGY